MTDERTATLPIETSNQYQEELPPIPAATTVARNALGSLFQGTGWTVLCVSVDFALASIAVLLALRSAKSFSAERSTVLALPALIVPLLLIRGGYRRRLRVLALDWLPPVVTAVSVATMAVVTLALLIDGRVTDPSLWLRVWLLSVLLVCGGRALLVLAHRRVRSRGLVAQPVLIIGAGIIGKRIARRLEAHPQYGLFPVGFVDDHPPSAEDVGQSSAPVLGTLDDTEKILSTTGAQSLIAAFSSAPDTRVNGVIRGCQDLGVEVSVVPRMFDTINNRVSYDTVGGLPLLSFDAVDRAGWQFTLKHVLDRIAAAVLLMVLAPVMAAIALAVRATSPGPIVFRQRRVGRDGKVFDLYKFRSMHCEAPGGNEFLAARLAANDVAPGGVEGSKRLTSVGSVLRNFSLDELPQLVNVLKGDMSIIGPRPERPEFVERFGQEIAGYDERHRVKSGITGWAQVHGLRGPTSLRDRTEWDNYYIAHWSLGLDLKILALTIIALFRGG